MRLQRTLLAGVTVAETPGELLVEPFTKPDPSTCRQQANTVHSVAAAATTSKAVRLPAGVSIFLLVVHAGLEKYALAL